MEQDRNLTIDTNSIEAFLQFKQRAGWSDLMIHRTRKRLAVFCVDFSEDEQIMTDAFSRWKEVLSSRGLSNRTVGEYMSAAMQFMEYLGMDDLIERKTNALDLTGRSFGSLKVLKKAGGRKSCERSFLWECQCSCGNVVEIPANELTKGLHTSCGCQRVERLKAANRYVDGTSLRMVYSDKVRRDNTSGYAGIYRKNNQWAARIQYKGKRYYLGTFEKLEDAVSVRKEAEEKIREICTEEYLNHF